VSDVIGTPVCPHVQSWHRHQYAIPYTRTVCFGARTGRTWAYHFACLDWLLWDVLIFAEMSMTRHRIGTACRHFPIPLTSISSSIFADPPRILASGAGTDIPTALAQDLTYISRYLYQRSISGSLVPGDQMDPSRNVRSQSTRRYVCILIRMLQRLTAQSKQRARMWTSQSRTCSQVRWDTPSLRHLATANMPADGPIPAQNTMIYRFAMSRRLVSTSVPKC
jgi:hypothetical protein